MSKIYTFVPKAVVVVDSQKINSGRHRIYLNLSQNIPMFWVINKPTTRFRPFSKTGTGWTVRHILELRWWIKALKLCAPAIQLLCDLIRFLQKQIKMVRCCACMLLILPLSCLWLAIGGGLFVCLIQLKILFHLHGYIRMFPCSISANGHFSPLPNFLCGVSR